MGGGDRARPCAHAVNERRPVPRVVAQLVDEGVRLDVRLGDDVQTKLVARVEERRIIGVVRRADGVEAEPLHSFVIWHAGKTVAEGDPLYLTEEVACQTLKGIQDVILVYE